MHKSFTYYLLLEITKNYIDTQLKENEDRQFRKIVCIYIFTNFRSRKVNSVEYQIAVKLRRSTENAEFKFSTGRFSASDENLTSTRGYSFKNS